MLLVGMCPNIEKFQLLCSAVLFTCMQNLLLFTCMENLFKWNSRFNLHMNFSKLQKVVFCGRMKEITGNDNLDGRLQVASTNVSGDHRIHH